MMNRISISVWIQTIIIVVCLAHSVFSLKCYICNSVNDAECSKSSPPSKYLQECSRNPSTIASDMYLETKLHQVAAAMSPNVMTPPVAPTPGEAASKPASSISSSTAPNTAVNKEDKNLNRTARGIEEGYQQGGGGGAGSPGGSFPPSNDKAQFCRKITFYIGAQNNGPNNTMPKTERVLRSCGWITEDDGIKNGKTKLSCKSSGNKAVQMKDCVCSSGDGCNAGSQLIFSLPQSLIFLAIMTAGYIHIF